MYVQWNEIITMNIFYLMLWNDFKLIYTNMIIIMPSWMMHETIMMNDDYISMPLYFYKKKLIKCWLIINIK